MQSLVNLRAMDVQRELLTHGYFELGSYNQPIAIVIPVVETKEELIAVFKKLEKYIKKE